MSNAPTPPPDVLRVLLRFPFDAVAAGKVLKRDDVKRWMAGIARSIWRKDRVLRNTFAEEDFAGELVGGLWMKLTQLRSQPNDRDPAAYLAGILRNLAKDEWRRRVAQKRGGGQVDVEFDGNTDAARDGGAAVRAEEGQRVERVIATARRAGVLTGGRRAVFIGMIAPEALESSEVVEAGKTFVRGPAPTMTLVKRMLRNTLPPVLDSGATETFAWIARCPDPVEVTRSWAAWRTHDVRAARTALDTVQKNFRRAREDVLEALNAEGGEA